MSTPSPQEQTPVDCRKCVHCMDLVEGESFRCKKKPRSGAFAWFMRTWACEDFSTDPAPAHPPVSADREGPDALDAMRLAVTALEHDVPGECWATGPNTGDPVEDLVVCPGCRALATLRRAIAAEEARRARPAQWSHVWRCSGCCEMRPEQGVVDPRWLWNGSVWDHQCDASHREPARDFGLAVEDPHRAAGRDLFHAVTTLDRYIETEAGMTHEQRVAVYRQAYLAQEAWLAIDPEAQRVRPAVEDPRDALLRRCATEIDRVLIARCCGCGLLRRVRGPCPHCGTDPMTVKVIIGGADFLHGLLAALRAAGVEPAPEAQEGKATP